MRETTKGILALIAACTVWGLSPIYYKALAGVPPLEVLSHRTLWSMVVFGAVLAVQGRLADVGRVLRGRQAGIVLLGAVMISVNWFVFIRSIQLGHGVEASLGYYIFPLVAVGIGVVAFGERVSVWQGAAVALAGAAVLLLTIGLGVAPWVALILAGTFGVYGMVKKRLTVGAVVSVTAEVVILAPLAVGWLLWLHISGAGGQFGGDLRISGLLAFAGVLTAVPLMLFSYASRRVSMATFGLTQYLNPTLQFLVAVLVFREAFTGWHVAAFAMIWAAVGLYSVGVWRQEKPDASTAVNAGTSSITVV